MEEKKKLFEIKDFRSHEKNTEAFISYIDSECEKLRSDDYINRFDSNKKLIEDIINFIYFNKKGSYDDYGYSKRVLYNNLNDASKLIVLTKSINIISEFNEKFKLTNNVDFVIHELNDEECLIKVYESDLNKEDVVIKLILIINEMRADIKELSKMPVNSKGKYKK